MLKFQICTANDNREAAIISKRRRYEEERRKRIFDSKSRIFGVNLLIFISKVKIKYVLFSD